MNFALKDLWIPQGKINLVKLFTKTNLKLQKMYFYYGIALLSILTSPAWSYSEGAPNDQETCKTLFPGHFTDPQASQPPYTIQVSKQTVKPKQTVTLILRGKTEDDTFKGFMIQARQNEVPIGKFGIGESTDFVQLRTCSNEADTASHKKVRGRSMNEVSFTWTAPDNASGTVSFVGTIVKNRPTFWVANTFAEVTVA